MSGIGDQRRRLVRHHAPLALASGVALLVFTTLPTFDTARGRGADLTSGPLPQVRGDRPEDHGTSQPALSGHQASSPGPSGHAGAQPTPSSPGPPQPSPPSPAGGHGGSGGHSVGQGGTGGHSGGEGGSMEPGASPATSQDAEQPMAMGGSSSSIQRFTIVTGYIALGLLALTLLIGPAHLLLRRRNPVSSYLRRDAGAWTAGFSIVHVIAGLQVHGQLSDFVAYFVAADGSPLLNSFGLGNWTGLAATAVVVGLLAISSDLALRKLTARPWKRLQRLNYALFALVLAHAFFYGALLRIASPFTLLLVIGTAAVAIGQVVGIWLWRRRRVRPGASPA